MGRLDGIGLRSFRQRETPDEVARHTLDALVVAFGLLRPGLALTLDGQHTGLGGDFNVIRADAGKIGAYNIALCLFVNVDRGNPGHRARGLKLPGEAVDQRPRFIANDSHEFVSSIATTANDTDLWLAAVLSRAGPVETGVESLWATCVAAAYRLWAAWHNILGCAVNDIFGF